MFFVLSKTIGLLVRPLIWLIIGMAVAVFCRKPKLKKISIRASLIILLVFTNPLIINFVLRVCEPAPVAVSTLPTYDVGVLLGGFSRHLPESNNIELTNAGDRLWQTVSLYHQGKIRKILISGGNYTDAQSEAITVYDALMATGIPDSVLLVEKESLNTRENAVFSAELIAENLPDATCILITSALHMKRSLACFRKAGLNPDAFPAEHITRYDKVFWAHWLRPNAETLRHWELIINEWTGIIVYRIKKYI